MAHWQQTSDISTCGPKVDRRLRNLKRAWIGGLVLVPFHPQIHILRISSELPKLMALGTRPLKSMET